MTNLKRIKYTVIFSEPNFNFNKVYMILSEKIAKKYGGGCFESIYGCWAEDGEKFLDSYGSIKLEEGIKLSITIDSKLDDVFYNDLVSMIKEMKKSNAMSFEWVHVEREDIIVKHFKV